MTRNTLPALPTDPALRRLWAKSPRASESEGEGLAEHTAHVLLRLSQQRALRPGLAAEVGEPRLWHRLFWATFIHDWGKAARGFQAQVRPGGPKWGKRHEVLSLAFLPYVAARNSEDWLWIAAAIAAHHRDRESLEEQYNVATGRAVHLQQVRELVDEVDGSALAALWRWLHASGWDWALSLGFDDVSRPVPLDRPEPALEFRRRAPEDICTALTDYYDWVADLEQRAARAPLPLPALLLRGLLVTADHSGSAHAQPFQPVPLVPAAQLLGRLENEWETTAYNHQYRCAEAGDSVMLVAPTGSGKTESALLWAANQRREGQEPPRLFYVLPYQASMNAMQERLKKYCGGRGVGLQHGKARHALYRQYLEREQTPEQAAWAARVEADLTRLNVPPVRVLSPYQLLKAFYRLRGYEATLADTCDGLFICDEIHAYEVKRLALIVSMLGTLRREFNARFCLMSATFPALLRQWLEEEIQPLQEITAAPETQAQFRRHHVRLAPGELTDPDALEHIVRTAQAGLSVLVCCNTVSRAQQVLQALEGRGLRPELLHSRFHARDRIGKEELLQERMGTRAVGTDRRVVMVATQVVEVSLDIDFDTLFTDPAPLDALLQRFGRINRGRKATSREVTVFSGPIVDERPYAELLLRGALRVLEREFGREGALLEESRVSDWLNEIYAGPVAQEWEVQYRRAKAEFEQVILGRLYPFQSDRALEELFYRAFDGVEVLPSSLRDEYRSEASLLAASALLVPIRWSQFERLRRAGALESPEPDGTVVVARPYSKRLGLELF